MRIKHYLLLGFLAGLFGLAGYLISSDQLPSLDDHEETQMSSGEERQVLEWEFQDLKGDKRPLSSWVNDVVVINFWATWCPPCLREIPLFTMLQEKYRKNGVQFIGVALDSEASVREFKETTVVNYPLLIGDADVVRFMEVLGNEIGALPFTVVLSRDGGLLYSHMGEWEQVDAEKELVKIMKNLQISR